MLVLPSDGRARGPPRWNRPALGKGLPGSSVLQSSTEEKAVEFIRATVGASEKVCQAMQNGIKQVENHSKASEEQHNSESGCRALGGRLARPTELVWS